MIESELLPLFLPMLGLLALAVGAGAAAGSWLAPAPLFAVYWAVQVALGLIVPDYRPGAPALWWICATVLAFQLAAMLAELACRQLLAPPQNLRVRVLGPELVLWVSTIAGALYVVAVELMNLELSVETPPLYLQALLPFCYAGPLVGGLVYSARALERRRWTTVLPLLPPFALGVLFTGRNVILLPSVLWLAGWLAMRACGSSDRRIRLSSRSVLIVAAAAGAFVSVGVVIQVLRDVRQPGLDVWEKLAAFHAALLAADFGDAWGRLRFAVFGTTYAFSAYFSTAWSHPPEPAWGAITFAAPLELLGFGGIRYPFESFEIEAGVQSNVFSMLRPPIDDFGFAGSLSWWGLVGAAQGVAWCGTRAGVVLCVPLLAWFYSDLAVTMSFRYNTTIAAYALATVYMAAVARVPAPQS